MKLYQLKVAVKKAKPPVWKRCLIPSGISFSQLSILLNEIMQIQSRPVYLFEFYQRKLHIKESNGEQEFHPVWNYDLVEAAETWVDELLEQEEWFSYTLTDEVRPSQRDLDYGMPCEYTLPDEVRPSLKDQNYTMFAESGTESKVSFRITIEGTVMEEIPYPVILKCRGSQADVETMDIVGLNQRLKEKFYVTYGFPQPLCQRELYEKLDAGNVGFLGNRHPINNPENIKKCADSKMREFAGQLSDRLFGKEEEYLDVDEDRNIIWTRETESKMAQMIGELKHMARQTALEQFTPEQRDELQKCRKVQLKTVLESYAKSDLVELAREHNVSRFSGLNKAELAGKIANQLLMPSIMKRKLCVVNDEQIELFEEIADSDTVYWLEEEQFEILDELIYLDYIVVDDLDRAEVPVDVKQVYDRINTEEFHSQRKKIVWTLKCLNVMNVLYGITPIKIFRKVFRKNPEFRAESDDFMEIFYKIPLDKNPCTIVEDKIVYREILRDELYKKIEDRQEDKKFYIPTLEEIEDYAEHGYFSKAPEYDRLRHFLKGQMQVSEFETEEILFHVFQLVCGGANFRDMMDYFGEKNIVFSDKTLETFANIMMDVNNNTRMFLHRGFTPNEIREWMRDAGRYQSKPPTIVPMSTMAAHMLREGEQQIRDMGFAVNLDGNAAEFPVTVFPDGINGAAKTTSKKIYPNDPCPCGSGKKYKKCCGKK